MEKLKTLWPYLLTRLEEPSTYAGGSVLATLVAAVFPGHLGSSILAAMAAIGAVLAIVIPEKKPLVVLTTEMDKQSILRAGMPEATIVVPESTKIVIK